MEVLILLLTLAWVAFWLLNLVLNGRFWVWEFWSAVPGWFWGATWLVLFIPAVIAFNLVSVVLLLFTVPLWWPCLDLSLWPEQKADINSEGIKLFNWNTQHWAYGPKPEFFEFLQAQNADIYHLQEAWTQDLVLYDAKADLEQYFPGYQIVQSSELVTMTRLKVVGVKADSAKPFLRVDIDVNGKVVSFYNVHISVHFIPRYLRQSVSKFLSDAKRRFGLRVEEFRLLNAELNSNPNPFVFSGDFNTTTFMRAVRPLLSRYRDACRSLKRGFATTWYGAFSLKWWRIDYVMGQKIYYSNYELVGPGKLSDHWGQRVTVGV